MHKYKLIIIKKKKTKTTTQKTVQNEEINLDSGHLSPSLSPASNVTLDITCAKSWFLRFPRHSRARDITVLLIPRHADRRQDSH